MGFQNAPTVKIGLKSGWIQIPVYYHTANLYSWLSKAICSLNAELFKFENERENILKIKVMKITAKWSFNGSANSRREQLLISHPLSMT